MTYETLSARALCTVDDVLRFVPGGTAGGDTEDVLVSLINGETTTFHRDTGREFKTIAGATTRQYDLTAWNAHTRRVRVGDMTTVTTVTVKDQQGTLLETVTAANRVALPRVREEWEPITELWFPPQSATPASFIGPGNVLEVVGAWGFPAVPTDVRNAVANMVLVRYIADAAASGTSLADALNEQQFNAGAAFASAQAVKRSYQAPPFA